RHLDSLRRIRLHQKRERTCAPIPSAKLIEVRAQCSKLTQIGDVDGEEPSGVSCRSAITGFGEAARIDPGSAGRQWFYDADGRNVEEVAVPGLLWRRPQVPQHAHALAEAPAAVFEAHARRTELFRNPASTHAGDQSSAGQPVERRD